MTHHILSSTAVVGVDLPAETLDLLTTVGVPRDVCLEDWLGPSLFSSDIADGRLFSTTEPDARVVRTTPHYLVGVVRDQTGPSVYASFALTRGTGAVMLLDANDPEGDRFVNSTLGVFLTCVEAFRVAWPAMTGDEHRQRHVKAFRKLLGHLDESALAHPENYWTGWLEELE